MLPILIIARRHLRHVSEICCDLSVAYVLKEKTATYRETLLNTSRRFHADAVLHGIGLLDICKEPSRIIARLKWLEKDTWKNQKRKIATTIITGLIMLFCVLPMNGFSQPTVQNEHLLVQPGTNSDEFDGMNSREKTETDQPFFLIEALIVEADKEIAFQATNINGGQKEIQAFNILSDCEITLGDKTFSDIETAIQNLSDSSDVKILQTPKMLATNEGRSITVGKIGNPPVFNLEITSDLLENGDIHQDLFVAVSFETDINEYSDHRNTEIQFREGDMVVLVIPSKESTYQSRLIIFMTTRIVGFVTAPPPGINFTSQGK